MDFNEILVDIILNEKHDGDKDIDWLYGEYVKRGYNKSKEMFCEEFVISMNDRGIKYLTEPEVNNVAGGNGKFIKRGASVGLAAALLAGPMMPTQGADVPGPRTVVSENISKGNHGKSIQGLYKKAPRIINKIFNDKDAETISQLTLGAIVTLMLGKGSAYLISRIVKESTTPAEVLQKTANGIHGILDDDRQEEASEKKEAILTLLKDCLDELLKFAKKEQKPYLKEIYERTFGTGNETNVFNNWKELQDAFTEVFDAIKEKLTMKTENNPLEKLFEQRENELMETIFARRETELTAVFENKKNPKNEEENDKNKKEGKEDPVEDPAEYPTEESAEYPTEDPAEYPTEDPAEYPTEDPAEYPTEDPAEYPTEDPAEDPAEYPTEESEEKEKETKEEEEEEENDKHKKKEEEENQQEENQQEENQQEENQQEENQQEEGQQAKDQQENETIEDEKIGENESSVLLPHCTSIFDSNYNINDPHGSYTTDELEDNGTVSKETGINRNVLDAVNNFVQEQDTGINYKELTENSILVVCKNVTIDDSLKDNLKDKIEEISKVHGEKNLYLVLKDCTVDHTYLSGNSAIKVLDLRGTTKFNFFLTCEVSVDKVLMRNNSGENALQLWLTSCKKLGPIYQLSKDTRQFNPNRLFLSGCHLDDTFRFVNLNTCCDQLLNKYCISKCRCPAGSRYTILNSFAMKSQPDKRDLQGI